MTSAVKASPVAVAAVVVIVCSAVMAPVGAFRKGYHCGHSVPEIVERHRLLEDGAAHPQLYHTVNPQVDEDHPRRILTSQAYPTGAGSSYLTIDEAHANGVTAPIRIKLVWDQVDNAESYQCSETTTTVPLAFSSDTHTCTGEDRIFPGNARYDIAKARTEWAMEELQRWLYVKPVQDTITLQNNIGFDHVSAGDSWPNYDLVILMTARPEPGRGVAAYALCYQRDQHGRCTIGQFNWVPEVFLVDRAGSSDVISSERHTAMHEIIHVLGGMRPGPSFTDSTGAIIIASSSSRVALQAGVDAGILEVDNGSGVTDASVTPHYAKATTWITTPRVQDVVRRYFQCDTMKGMALEDIPLSGGAGAHWEARLMGPEVMSYGSGSGEAYLSELTMAFLEDTNQYRVDNSTDPGGRLVPDSPAAGACNETGSTAVVDFLFGNDVGSQDYTPPPPLPAAALRWGRGQGCAFVSQSAAEWSDRYVCTQNREYGCSPDNRMSAVCSIRADWQFPDNRISGGSILDLADGVFSETCSGSGPCLLPSYFQHFDSDAAATAAAGVTSASAARTGGYSLAMDFAPVRIGYWNCQDQEAVDPSLLIAEEAPVEDSGTIASANVTELGTETAVEEQRLVGGQCRCPDCRCFVSSLLEVTSTNFNPTFPRLGMCYRSNCYREDYLQFGVVDPFVKKVFWYKCPTNGGKLFVPGFSGAFHCPDVVEFCKQETITGVKMAEFVAWQLWLLIGVLASVMFVPLLLCLCPCTRNPFVGCLKRWCGVYHFAAPAKGDGEKAKRVAPPRCLGCALLTVNVITLVVGLAMVGGLVYMVATDKLAARGTFIVFVAAATTLLSILGAVGAKKKARGASCPVLVYFFASLFITLGTVLASVNVLLIQDDLASHVDDQWDFYEDALSSQYDANDPPAEQRADVTQFLEDNLVYLLVGMFTLATFFLVGLVFAGCIIKGKVLTSISFTVLNNAHCFVGILMVAAGVAMRTTDALGALSNLEPVIGPVTWAFIGGGALLVLLTFVGLYGAFAKRQGVLAMYGVAAAIAVVAYLYGVGYCRGESDAAHITVDELDDEDLEDLETARSREELEDDLILFYDTAMVAFAVEAVLFVVILLSLARFMCAVKAWKAERRYTGSKSSPRKSNTIHMAEAPPVANHPGASGPPPHAVEVSSYHTEEEYAPPPQANYSPLQHQQQQYQQQPQQPPQAGAAYAVPPPAVGAGSGGRAPHPYEAVPAHNPYAGKQQAPLII